VSQFVSEIDLAQGLRARTKIVLYNAGISTVDQLTEMTKEQILQLQNAGEHTLPDIIVFLETKGKTLKP